MKVFDMEMRDIDVLNNIKGHDYDIGGYHLCRAEAEQCIKALEKQIPNKVKQVGTIGNVPTFQCECNNIIHGQAQYCDKCGQRVKI